MKIKKILVLLLFMVAIIGIITPINAESTNNKVKIKWDANGGKIGSEKTVTTNINKGSKIGTLQKATRTGYTLKGWYTKSTGGTKISKDTKPTNSVIYYAQWTKENYKSKSIVGKWVAKYKMSSGLNCTDTCIFKKDGTYNQDIVYVGGSREFKGKYKISAKNTISFFSVEYSITNASLGARLNWRPLADYSSINLFLKDSKGEYFQLVKDGSKYYKS